MLDRKEVAEEVRLITDTAESIIIRNEQELQEATNFIKEIKEKQKQVKFIYDPIVKSAKNNYDEVRFERDKFLKPLKDTEKEIRDLMNNYNTKVMELKKAEEARIKKEKEEQEKELKKLQEDLKNGNTENLQEKVDSIMNKTTLSEKKVEIPKVAGMGTKTTYEIEVLDISKIPTTYNNVPIVEISKLGKKYIIEQYKAMKSLNLPFDIPGIKIHEKVTTIIRS